MEPPKAAETRVLVCAGTLVPRGRGAPCWLAGWLSAHRAHVPGTLWVTGLASSSRGITDGDLCHQGPGSAVPCLYCLSLLLRCWSPRGTELWQAPTQLEPNRWGFQEVEVLFLAPQPLSLWRYQAGDPRGFMLLLPARGEGPLSFLELGSLGSLSFSKTSVCVCAHACARVCV